jgi:hypothetical protein
LPTRLPPVDSTEASIRHFPTPFPRVTGESLKSFRQLMQSFLPGKPSSRSWEGTIREKGERRRTWRGAAPLKLVKRSGKGGRKNSSAILSAPPDFHRTGLSSRGYEAGADKMALKECSLAAGLAGDGQFTDYREK